MITQQELKFDKLNALKRTVESLQPDYINEDQLDQICKILGMSPTPAHQSMSCLTDEFFYTENLIHELSNDIAALETSDLLINNELQFKKKKEELVLLQERLNRLTTSIIKDKQELEKFRHLDCSGHCERAQDLKDYAQNQ